MGTPQYSRREEMANSLSHGLGAIASAVGLVVMVMTTSHEGTARLVSVAVFAGSLLLLYSTSTIYHGLSNARGKAIMRNLDHAAIYILIAGSTTPVALMVIGGRRGLALLITIWSLALFGIVSELTMARRQWLSVSLYLIMGWLMMVVAGPLFSSLDGTESALIVGGGLSYTIGVPFYLWRSLPFAHLIWHCFVLAGSVFHYVAIFLAVAMV